MKTLIIGLLFFSFAISSNAQKVREWNKTYSINKALTGVVFAPDEDGNIAPYGWTWSVITTGLADSIKLEFGGSNIPINDTLYSFETFESDALPYWFNQADEADTTRWIDGDGVIQDTIIFGHSFHSSPEKYGFKRPHAKVTTTTDTVFTLEFRVLYFY